MGGMKEVHLYVESKRHFRLVRSLSKARARARERNYTCKCVHEFNANIVSRYIYIHV